MVLDSIHAHTFYRQMTTGVKFLLFLELLIVLLCMLMMKKDIFVSVKGPTQRLSDPIYHINFIQTVKMLV